ncbi:MAG: DUF3343 domain-containing protein [Thermoplasmata archaeon]|nr:MAG: DUF3343 domain-containing protein [Thermoplasmata archaeon]
MNDEYCVVLFYSTSLAVRGEKIAKKAGLKVKLVPTPRHLSSDCGTALRLEARDKEALIFAFEEANLDYDRITPL